MHPAGAIKGFTMFKTLLLVGASTMALSATSAEALTFVYTGTVQHYTVATTGTYNLVAAGARGGSGFDLSSSTPALVGGGQGIAIGANVKLTAGTVLDIVVGGAGSDGRPSTGFVVPVSGGGGGGSFIVTGSGSAVVIGGGGGGSGIVGSFGGNSGGGSASSGQAGASGNLRGGAGGTGGLGGQGGAAAYRDGDKFAGFNGGGGGGLNGAGGDGLNWLSATGGSSGPSFAGGFYPAEPATGIGGFGGGGGSAPLFGYIGGVGGGGGGGGFSGGGGGGGGFLIELENGDLGVTDGGGGGGGGSFTWADATDITAVLNRQSDGNGFASVDRVASPVGGVPEPSSWALLTGGFGMIGAAMRRRKTRLA